jgi:hypothetical protein
VAVCTWPNRANHTGLSKEELAYAERVVACHLQEIIDAWHEHFGG